MSNLQIAMPEPVALPRRKIRLRWRFVYQGRPDRKGVWDSAASQSDPTSAWSQPKDGLLWAIVEGESHFNHELFTILEVPGQDYAHCTWEVYTPAPTFGLKNAGPANVAIEVTPRVMGLSLWTREKKFTVFIDGDVQVRYLTAAEKKFDLHEHRAGA